MGAALNNRHSSNARIPTPHPPPQIAQTFRDYINSLATWEKAILANCTLTHHPTETMHRLNAGPITSGSDGSVRHPHATFGFVVCDHTHQMNDSRPRTSTRIRSQFLTERGVWSPCHVAMFDQLVSIYKHSNPIYNFTCTRQHILNKKNKHT